MNYHMPVLKRTLHICQVAFWMFICLTTGLYGQNVKKGYKLLEKLDYEKSREVFLDALNENSQDPAALFGLALIYADEKSPYYDLIQSWEHTRNVKQYLDKLTPEETEFIGEYFYNTEVRHINRPVRKKIEYALETIEAKLIKYIREENNLEIVYEVIEKFPDFRHYDNVIHIRNQLEFRKYEKLNQLDGYLEFIRKFPDAAQVDKAIKYRNRLAFEKVCQVNTVEAYRDFIKTYPEASEINQAIKNLNAVAFERAKQKNTIAAFDQFISDYPDALEISEARVIQKQLLYEYAKKIQTLEAYNEFIRKYPEGQQYIDIFNLKALDNGMRFMNQHPLPTNNVQWARSFDEEGNQELSACLTVDTLNNYLAGSTVLKSDTGSTDVWIIKMTQDGKMIWNKYIGEGFNDQVDMLAVNRENEILGAGYTWLGTDSASIEAWLFKLGPDGQKIWSKTLGRMHIRTILPARSGETFLGGYLVDDSLRRKYSLIVLNESGKRLWSRTYTGTGEILQIAEFPDQHILMVGNHWRAKTDARGYLVWESSTAITDSIVSAQLLPRGEIAYLAVRNNQKLIFSKTSQDNKVILEKEITLPEIPIAVSGMLKSASNQLIVTFSFGQYQTINWINTASGTISASAKIPEGFLIEGMVTDRKNNLLFTGCNGEVLVIRNNGSSF
jgi:tetratricopeptide (TPR) repeat protein